MYQQYFEMQALTWRATQPIQQDAILIGNQVIQHDGLISKRYVYPTHEYWCTAISDGVSRSPKADKASKAVLNSVLAQSQAKQHVDLQHIQDDLSTALAASSKTYSASATLALVSHASPQGFVKIQHVGDSRVYLFSDCQQKWYALTKDHNFLNEMADNGEIDIIIGQQYASFYYMLSHCFCADSLHEVPEFSPKEQYLTDGDALLICSDGVYDVLQCSDWQPLLPETTLKTWLIEMKNALNQKYAFDNVSMILIRLTKQGQ
ncbi:MAG: serine/threonine protein phosphatase [Acinetobacter sp.]|jgi:serine/threonine protein phosphatase PrpC|nr:MAG: serine/threonine protein phosphatase [Acinetobacter sp.]